MPDRYCLIAALGLSPAVLTETVWSLWRDHEAVPSEVHILTTRIGWERLCETLLGVASSSEEGGTQPAPPPHTATPWAELCRDVLGLSAPVALVPHLTRDAEGRVLDDLRSEADDLAFGAVCYELVRGRTASRDAPSVVGSIAGGRKTMSAHLTTAFALWARPQDRLVHVLIAPPEYERKAVYWPTDATPDLRVDRVDVPFPRVRGVLEQQFLDRLGGRSDLASLLGVLAAQDAEATPAQVRVTLCQRHPARCPVALLSTDGTVLAEAGFTPRMIGILLVLAEATAAAHATHGGPFGAVLHAREERGLDAGPLIDSDRVEAQLLAVYRWCGRIHLLPGYERSSERKTPPPSQRWMDGRAITDAVSKYHDRSGLGDETRIPSLMQEALRFKTEKGHVLLGRGAEGIAHPASRYWHWATGRALSIEVVSPDGPPKNDTWPFTHIPPPTTAG
ncbi:MAG: CRISPR-associated ring nuclease Csm6 [Bacteroidota bacterium]